MGRELEIGWLPPLVQQSRNGKIQPGAEGYLDASPGAQILEIPTGQITRAMGDVHPLGNPHYWMDPENGKRIAKEMADAASIGCGRATARTSTSGWAISPRAWTRRKSGGWR